MSGDGSSMPVRLLPLPGQGPPAHQEAEGEWSSRCGVGITFSLTERGGVDLSGPVVSHVLPGSSADVDGTVQSGDRLVSIDGEPVRTWSMAKVRRVISNKAGARVSLEFDRDGEKLLATLSRGLLGGGGAALEVSHADASSAQLSLSALSGKDPAPSVSRLGGSNMAQVEQLQARCKVTPPTKRRPCVVALPVHTCSTRSFIDRV